MKTLLRIIIPVAFYFIYLLSAKAQTTTNVLFDVRVERVTAGVTNANSTSFNMVPSSNKDVARINGLSYYFSYRTNLSDRFDQWIAKEWLKEKTTTAGDEYNRSIVVDTLNKLAALATTGGLSASDLATLTTISNKTPVP